MYSDVLNEWKRKVSILKTASGVNGNIGPFSAR